MMCKSKFVLLSQQLDAIFVASKLHQVSNMFETSVISRRQIALKIAPGLHVPFSKVASSCRDKNCLCKQAFRELVSFVPPRELVSFHST